MGNLRFDTLIANEKAFKLRYDVLRVKRGAAHLRQIQESDAVTIANPFRPVTPPQVIEGAYSDDRHLRMFKVVRENGPWPLILAQHFKSPEEVIATTSGTMPEGFERSWDMFLPPVFSGYFAQGHTAVYPYRAGRHGFDRLSPVISA
ncbi:hypothetical protein [Sphingomonas sp. VDB2]|uniref:hypothetical protein n=1 Tax=Sphingomonas sp. VDB2 TaxID=3228751 RepID=UPI003A7F8130